MKRYIVLSTIALTFSSCTYKSFTDTIEGIYTDEVVIKPTKSNYKTLPANSTKPIISEKTETKTKQDSKKITTTRIKRVGKIISHSYDSDVNLYIYNFTTDGSDELIVFFYDKKLPYTPDDLVSIDVKDNFLMNIHKKDSTSSNSLTPSQKKKKFKKKRFNYNIQTPIEEKINTF